MVTIKGEIYQGLLNLQKSDTFCDITNLMPNNKFVFFFFFNEERLLTERFADDSETWHIYGSNSAVQIMFMSLILRIIRA